MPKKEALLYYGFWAVVIGVCIYLGISRPAAAEKITFERLSPSATSEPARAKSKNIQVHVTGAVRKPGVYTLKPDSRVHDAIRIAGGAKPTANLDEWNLAARVNDGSNLHINSKATSVKAPKTVASRRSRPKSSMEIAPLRIQVPEEYRGGANAFAEGGRISVQPDSKPVARSSGKKQLPPESSISLNTAGAADLQRLPGVGPSTASKILEYRQEHGGFTSVDELLAVKGIGPKKLESMRRFLKL